MSTAKRCISLFLVLGILFGILAPTAQATPSDDAASLNNDNVTIEGTNDFGDLLSQEIIQSQEETAEEAADYPGGYTVTDLEIEDGVATVTYDSMEEATLVVALYTEDGMQMVSSASAIVTPEEATATVTFNGELPEYFLASAYLLDSYDLSPLCAAYDTPMYTQEMQELLASTVDDYDPEKILNLDDDETTNFAVYADSTIVIDAVEGVNTVSSIDDENATYVIKNADEQITSLVEGNVFVYPYAEGEILIVKVSTITIDGTTATISGSELELEEVFSHMKVESNSTTADITIDDSTAAEGISYIGLEEDSIAPQAWEGGGSTTVSHKFKIDIEKEKESDYVDASFSVTGSLNVSIDVGLNYYISLKRQFIEFKATPSVSLGVNLTGNITGKFPIGNFGVSPVPGVFIGFSPEIQLRFEGTADLSANVSMTIGFSFSSDNGFDNLTTKPKVTFDLSVEGKVFFGVNFKPNAKIIHEKIASLTIGAEVGFELTAKITGTLFEYYESDAPKKHTCTSCLALDVDFKATLDGELKFLNCDWLSVKIDIAKLTFDLGSWHKSSREDSFKKGECQNYTYRLTIHVQDAAKEPVSGAQVQVSDKRTQTNSKGNAAFYFPEGLYTVTVTDDVLTRDKNVSIVEETKLTINLTEDDVDSSNILDLADDAFKSETADFVDGLDATLAVYNGHTYTLFDGKAHSWEAAREYCEYLGGHLATITTAEENAFLYDYMRYSGYSNAYWGLTDREVEGVWEWCTGEPVTYLNWASGEPNNGRNGTEHYGMFHSGAGCPPGYWNDGNFGDDGYAFLCEWDYVLQEDLVVHNNHAYQLIHADVSSWEESQAYCESLGGHLATITSAEENDFIYSYIVECGHRNAYFGLTDKYNEGTWEWCNGEPVSYTNWPQDQPSDNVGEENYGMYWDHYSHGEWNDGGYHKHFPFICEWDNAADSLSLSQLRSSDPDQLIAPNAVYPGDYGTEPTDSYTVKTAAFKDLVPNEQYALLAIISVEAEDPLSSDNLLFIDQAAAEEDGTLTFRYVQRTLCDISYVMVCGASHKNLNSAQITFPKMTSDGELQIVDPTVVYDGETLTEGRDYIIVGQVDFTKAGEYTCYIRGIHNYTGIVECTYQVTEDVPTNPFGDVASDSFYYAPVMWAVENGITTGISPTTFAPNNLCVRAQVVTFLWRAVGCPEPTRTDNPFVDVKQGDFYYKPVLWALENGITSGLDSTHFGPMTNCNRAQVVTFLYRTKGSPTIEATANPFEDVDKGSFYERAVLWAVDNGITTGLDATHFGPMANCNRAQIVTFLYRAFT